MNNKTKNLRLDLMKILYFKANKSNFRILLCNIFAMTYLAYPGSRHHRVYRVNLKATIFFLSKICNRKQLYFVLLDGRNNYKDPPRVNFANTLCLFDLQMFLSCQTQCKCSETGCIFMRRPVVWRHVRWPAFLLLFQTEQLHPGTCIDVETEEL